MKAPADRLLHAKILVEIGDSQAAEEEVAQVLEEAPEDLTALSLLAKIKHLRGEISQAVACWAQIHARAPHHEVALMHLGAILHLSQDPARSADEFVALNQFQLARKPVAQLELEKAFRLLLSRRPADARAVCERLAQRHRGRDRDTYKLAVLAQAWIADLSGDPALGCTILEGLGRERGFETDTDRVLFLMRLYEQIGTPDKLRAAVNICRFLEENFEKISVLGRLAAIYHRLGKAGPAQEYERRYLQAFRRRMHRPSLLEITQVAGRRYLPLRRLRRVRLTGAELPADLPQRERGVGLALLGDLAGARKALSGAEEVLDIKYRADIADLSGDEDEATALYLRSLTQDPGDLEILTWLLREPPGEPVRLFFQQAERGARALSALQAGIRAAPLSAQLWRALQTLCGLLNEPAEAARAGERATALETAARRRDQAVGRVLAAAVYHFVGRAKGLIHEVWADRKPAPAGRGGFLLDEDILGNLTPEMKQAVRNTFLAVREYARSKFPHLTGDILDYNYTYKVTKEDEPSGGLSAGLPTSLAFLSVFLKRPVPQDVAYSGMVIADSHDVLVLRRIGEAEYKVKGAYNRNLRMLVLPLENRQDLAANREVPPKVCEELVCYASSLDEAISLTFGGEIWM